MADPALQTFCCYPPGKGTNPAILVLDEFNSSSYNFVCLVSSLIGILGAAYQMLPRAETPLAHRWYTMTSSRGRFIIQWLAFADLLASLGVFMRSLLKLNDFLSPLETVPITYCAFFAAWIQYFYCVTWMWTLCYAVDMFLALREKPGYPRVYHVFSWVLPSILTITGLAILYLPNADCHNLGPDESPFFRILPNYLLTYLPMIAVMVVNPILYLCSLSTATLNPMQALLNSLVYRRSSERIITPFRSRPEKNASETTPLLPSDINGSSLVS